MIIKLLVLPFTVILNGAINLLPTVMFSTNGFVSLLDMIIKALQFFPSDVWLMFLGTITTWLLIHFLVGIVKFILGIFGG